MVSPGEKLGDVLVLKCDVVFVLITSKTCLKEVFSLRMNWLT